MVTSCFIPVATSIFLLTWRLLIYGEMLFVYGCLRYKFLKQNPKSIQLYVLAYFFWHIIIHGFLGPTFCMYFELINLGM